MQLEVELLRLFVTISFTLQKINEDKFNNLDEYCSSFCERQYIQGFCYISNLDHVTLPPPPTDSDFKHLFSCNTV